MGTAIRYLSTCQQQNYLTMQLVFWQLKYMSSTLQQIYKGTLKKKKLKCKSRNVLISVVHFKNILILTGNSYSMDMSILIKWKTDNVLIHLLKLVK